ncbi:MAG: type I DNA topoisomerase [bacterium]|nr:type I DNA topoisomerase [bacterium]
MSNLVIVESPSKAKTIHKYLGSDFKVLSSYGHVRDLPSKDGSVDPDQDFAMVWSQSDRGKKQIQEIKKALKEADTLYLATDPDREGEAISWHVLELLKSSLGSKKVHRVVFYEITKQAVQKAIAEPRALDQNLIDAYLARRALDYLVGFTLSPVLWRKLPGSRSAGRVQSVALRIIADRETEIDLFKAQEYWSIEGDFTLDNKRSLTAKLTYLEGKKLDKLSLGNEAVAKAAEKRLLESVFHVASVEKKEAKRHPSAPFTTSTLQQEAARKLGFSTKKTMQIAQQLYEGVDLGGETTGLITYMRTDSVSIASTAVTECRDTIQKFYGDSYLPKSPKAYKTKSKNAQEAHEAIRPTGFDRLSKNMGKALSEDQRKLYDLIWKRTTASQMSSARLDQVAIDLANASGQERFRATDSTITFDGFLKVYEEGRDDTKKEEEGILPPVTKDEEAALAKLLTNQHFTQPPPRYSEASLVKKLTELGIGRPSTYSSILSTLQDRDYVRIEKRRFWTEARGRIVTSFLTRFFDQYVEYDFTAKLEDQLDDISSGSLKWKSVMIDFWSQFKARTSEVSEVRTTEIIDALNEDLFVEDRACPKCKEGSLSLKNGRFGAFIGCSRYPDCGHTQQLSPAQKDGEGGDGDKAQQERVEPKVLGTDPESSDEVTLRKGPYGFYFQWGEAQKGKGKAKPKRVGLPKGYTPDQGTLELALSLASLPRALGKDPENGEDVSAGLGRFGPYIKVGKGFTSLPKSDDILTVSLERALEVVKEAPKKTRGKKQESK